MLRNSDERLGSQKNCGAASLAKLDNEHLVSKKLIKFRALALRLSYDKRLALGRLLASYSFEDGFEP